MNQLTNSLFEFNLLNNNNNNKLIIINNEKIILKYYGLNMKLLFINLLIVEQQ